MPTGTTLHHSYRSQKFEKASHLGYSNSRTADFLRKLMGYQFSIEYKAGTENSAADALSRRHENHYLQVCVAVSAGRYDFLDDLCKENLECADFKMLHKQLLDGTLDSTYYCSRNGLLLYKNRFMINKDSKLKTLLLQEFHETPTGGHAGVERTFLRLGGSFYWEGMRKKVKKFVEKCITCQAIKYSTTAPYGLLQPLEMLERVWQDLALDFIVGLPMSRGNSTILVVIDRLTKYAHFGALPSNYIASKVADLFTNMVIRLHVIPCTLVLDRDPISQATFGRNSLT